MHPITFQYANMYKRVHKGQGVPGSGVQGMQDRGVGGAGLRGAESAENAGEQGVQGTGVQRLKGTDSTQGYRQYRGCREQGSIGCRAQGFKDSRE